MQKHPRQIQPKLLLEFYKGETVPKLVSKHERERHNTSPLQYQHPYISAHSHKKSHSINSIHSKRTVENKNHYDDYEQMRKKLEQQKHENGELRDLIKDLTIKSDKLKEANEDLRKRLKQVEDTYEDFLRTYQRQKQQQEQHLKRKIYLDVEDYLKNMVQEFTAELTNQKMNPIVENKIQTFLSKLLQINPITIQQQKKQIKGQQIELNYEQINQTIDNIMKQRSRSKDSRRSPSPLIHRSHNPNMYKHIQRMNRACHTPQKHQTITQANKRPKIFSRNYMTQYKQNSQYKYMPNDELF